MGLQMKRRNFDKHAFFFLNLAHKGEMGTHTYTHIYSSNATSPSKQVNRQMEIDLIYLFMMCIHKIKPIIHVHTKVNPSYTI